MTTASGGHPATHAIEALADALRAMPGVRDVATCGALAAHTTWKVGGPADLLCVAGTVEGLAGAVRAAAEQGVPWRVLGRGSNVLVRDGGVEGLVILNRAAALAIEGTQVRVDSGLLLSVLAKRTASAGLAGMEWSAGIPGSVGGAIVSNAGAHGGAMSDTLRRVELLGPRGEPCWEQATALDLAYRHSRLRATDPPSAIVLRAELDLHQEDLLAIRARMNEQKRQRQATQPLASASAGSVFKNPPGDSAARLIDRAGLKGTCIGGATVSTRHANFMVTSAGARAADLIELIEMVRHRVRERYGVELVLEVQAIGRQAPNPA